MMAGMLGIKLDEIRFSTESAPAKNDFDIPRRDPIRKGTMASFRLRWEGLVNGTAVLENRQIWVCGDNTETPSDWAGRGQHGYLVDIKGNPNVHNMMLPIPTVDPCTMSTDEKKALGMLNTIEI